MSTHPTKSYDFAELNSQYFRFVAPTHFYSKPVKGMGLGVFCDVDLVPGDIWWLNSMTDQRFVERIVPWEDHKKRNPEERGADEIKCYVDPALRALVICTEPFCRVNHAHGNLGANSDTDAFGNSIITERIEAGQQILIPYDYEAVISILWKFPEVAKLLPSNLQQDEAFLLSSVKQHREVMDFLRKL
jgi:hypothetical protein